ncbi:uncharacterized protein LOC125271134 [Megalobrama amblycephala]|uniref:uncharacterized protein LOC125271134 n=1 Tax=Megalobrama amblycephala TaxID=75352 RepID=UPI0020147E48|nr:uncharacterized protein LOC125271134 [Megalobrama amblycephala]
MPSHGAPSVTPRTQTPPLLRDAMPPIPGPSVPSRCPTKGAPVVPLTLLAWFLGAWLELPNLSRWLIRTIRLGYAIQFAWRPPRFRGVRAMMVGKDAMIEPVPPAEMRSGFYSPYFIVPKKTGGLRPILDLRALNRALHRLPFKMLTPKRIFECVRPLDWFAAIDLKDAYFHVYSSSTQTVSSIYFQGAGISVQGPPLRVGPVSPRLHEGRRGSSGSPQGPGCPYSQLPRQLADSGTVSRAVVRAQGSSAQTPRPSGSSGQPGEEQTLPSAEDLFSRYGKKLSRHVRAAYERARAVSAELPESVCDALGDHHPSLLPNSLSVAGPEFSSNGSPLRTSVQAATITLPGMRTPGHVQSGQCFPFFKRGWIEGCLLPPLRSMWPLLPPIMTLLKVGLLGSTTWLLGS